MHYVVLISVKDLTEMLL